MTLWRPARHTVVSQDIDALPDAMLLLAKQQMRVETSYDDEQVRYSLQRAISRFQAVNEVCVNPTVVTWKPDSSDFANGAANIPVRPVQSFTANAGEPPIDAAADYSVALKWDSIHGVPIQVLVGAFTTGLALTLTCGVPAGQVPPPDVTDVLMRHAAHLYEHREILLPGQEYVAPDLAINATWWTPRL